MVTFGKPLSKFAVYRREIEVARLTHKATRGCYYSPLLAADNLWLAFLDLVQFEKSAAFDDFGFTDWNNTKIAKYPVTVRGTLGHRSLPFAEVVQRTANYVLPLGAVGPIFAAGGAKVSIIAQARMSILDQAVDPSEMIFTARHEIESCVREYAVQFLQGLVSVRSCHRFTPVC